MVTSFAKPSLKLINREPTQRSRVLGKTFSNMEKAQQKQRSGIHHHVLIKVQCAKQWLPKHTQKLIHIYQTSKFGSVTRESLQLFGEGGHNDIVLNDVRHLILQILLIKCNQGIWTSIPNLKQRTKLLLWFTTLSLCDHSGAIYGFPKEHVLHWTSTHQSHLTERKVLPDTLTKHQPPTAFEVARLTL